MLKPRSQTGNKARILASTLASSFWPRPQGTLVSALASSFWPRPWPRASGLGLGLELLASALASRHSGIGLCLELLASALASRHSGLGLGLKTLWYRPLPRASGLGLGLKTLWPRPWPQDTLVSALRFWSRARNSALCNDGEVKLLWSQATVSLEHDIADIAAQAKVQARLDGWTETVKGHQRAFFKFYWALISM